MHTHAPTRGPPLRARQVMAKLVALLGRQKSSGLTRALVLPALGKLCVQVRGGQGRW